MKVIFLDHDGVICLDPSDEGYRYNKQKKFYGDDINLKPTIKEVDILVRFDDFDKEAIETLNQILKETNAEIVVSSDWKRWATLEEMGLYYQDQGIIKKPIGFTDFYSKIKKDDWPIFEYPYRYELERSEEIKSWLDDNPHVTDWVAIDDLNMDQEFLSQVFTSETGQKPGLTNFVHTDPNIGLNQSGIKEKVLGFFK